MSSAWRELGFACSVPQALACYAGQPGACLLDSALTDGHLGTLSYLGVDPFLTLKAKGRRVEVRDGVGVRVLDADPWDVLQKLLRAHRVPAAVGDPLGAGGALGYFAYDLGWHLERLPNLAVDDLGAPDLYLGFYDTIVAFDERAGRTWVCSTGLPERGARAAARAAARLEERVRQLREAARVPPVEVFRDLSPALAGGNFTRPAYLEALRQVKRYITAGDIYQANLSQRFFAPLRERPLDTYLRLRRHNPAPFAAFVNYGDGVVLSASPERFLRLTDGVVETRPIKGTRPRGRTPAEDAALRNELAASEKDRAELLMIVDLERNDLGRAAEIGSVRVDELFKLEEYATVFHLVSTVRARLRAGLDQVDLLRVSFPGGSITGAPKIRAMEIIEELEPVKRGVYTGAIGYLGFGGEMDLNIVIRTIVAQDGAAYFQAGGGIVADSVPEDEFDETVHKARAQMEALGCRLSPG